MADESLNDANLKDATFRAWPVSEELIADNEALLAKARVVVVNLEETLSKVKTFLLTLEQEAPGVRQALVNGQTESETKPLTDVAAIRGLRAEVVKFNQQSVECLNLTSRYLQNREKFIIARRDWLAAQQR